MPDTTYRVVLALESTGTLSAGLTNLSEKIGAAERSQHALHHAMQQTGEVASHMAHAAGDAIEGLADKFIHVGEAAAIIGGGAIFAGAVYGVTQLNDQLEQTEISLAAIFQAQGFARDFSTAFDQAGEQLAHMKQDVKTLPGDLGQLSNMMKMIATPAAQGGLGPDAIRKMAGQTMLVSTVLGVQQDMAAREMANLLAGRAGAHNILGGRLGLLGGEAKRFNAEDPAKRVAEIEQLLGRYQGASDRFAQSFVANWTTLKDNIKYGFLADATSPLFDSVKHTMASINTWFDNNQAEDKSWANAFGTRLANVWNSLTSEAEKFGPALEHMGHVFFELWDKAVAEAHEIEPIMAKIAGFLEHVSAQDVTAAAKDVLELKLAGMGLSIAGTAISGAGTILRTADAWQRVTGAGTAAAAAGEAATAAAPAATTAEAVTGLGGAMAVSTLFGAGNLIIGAGQAVRDFTQTVHTDQEKYEVVKASQDKATESVNSLGLSMDANTAQSVMLQSALENLFIRIDHLNPTEPPPAIDRERDDTLALHSTFALSLMDKYKQDAIQKKPGGAGGTNIQKVEIVIKGSDDPSRVARLVVDQLQRVARNPTKSPHVTDFSLPR